MKREWSRRELYAHGEPFGDCATQRKITGGYICGGGGKGSAPPAPDYTGAAQQQAASSKEVTNMQTWANRPTQVTPFGSINWNTSATLDPATGQPVTQWTQQYNLTPEAQQALNSQLAVQQGRSDLAQSFMGRVSNEYSQPFNWGGMPARGGNVSTSQFQTLESAPQLQTGFGLEGTQRMGSSPSLQTNFGGLESAERLDGYDRAETIGSAPTLQSNIATQASQRVGESPTLQSNVGYDMAQMMGNAPTLQTGAPSVTQQQMLGSVGNLRTDAPDATNFQTIGSVGSVQSRVPTQAVQNQVNFDDNPALQGANSAERQRIENALFDRMRPIHDQQMAALETKLANQGVTPGSEAYNRAMQRLGDQQSRERFNALEMGGSEMARLNQMALANRQQMTNEDLAGANLFNSANNQAFNQSLQAGQFRNNALQQQLGMNQSIAGFNNAAGQARYQQELQNAQFGNQALQQQLGMNQAIAGFNNAADQNRYNQELQNAQFTNTALQNQNQMGLQNLQANNAATAQNNAQRLSNAQFANTALQNQFNMGLQGVQANNAAAQQDFNQGLSAAQFGNTALQNQYQMGLQGLQANNAAAQQNNAQALNYAQFNNAANQQDYAQRLGAAQFGNTALQNQYQMGLQNMQANNAAAQQDYAQRLGLAQFGNTALQNQQSLNQNQAAFNNQVAQNQFNQALQQSQYQNQLRQAAIAEEMQRRGMSLNEMNALLTGQQVGMTQMPSFNAAAAAQPVQYNQAAQNQYQAGLDAFNAQNMAGNSTMNGLFSLGSSLGSAFMFSDRRLKRIIRRIGKVRGIPLYVYKYLGSSAEEFGVIAQEVQKIRPDLVTRHRNGYLMVNYKALLEA